MKLICSFLDTVCVGAILTDVADMALTIRETGKNFKSFFLANRRETF
jgi:hypothetical protein